jgi:hypothetical protein
VGGNTALLRVVGDPKVCRHFLIIVTVYFANFWEHQTTAEMSSFLPPFIASESLKSARDSEAGEIK